jgi:hypothetical protein
MANPSWLKALKEACYHAHDPALHYDSEEGIVFCMLWEWEDYPTPIPPRWERPASLMHKYDTYSVEEVFALLQRATVEGNEHDRAFALILLGALATPKSLDIVRSFLTSPSLKERWASAIALGRHKEERTFPLLQTLLLDGFLVNAPSTSKEEAEKGQAGSQDAYPPIDDLSVSMKYEWYMHQRWECALVLGAWGNPCVVPLLIEALDTAWKMEQMWPDYGGFQDGPEIWHAFQDRLAFALGQLGAWHAPLDLDLPEKHLLIATIYLALGALQIQDPSIFYFDQARHLFSVPPYAQDFPWLQASRLAELPLAKQERIKQALERYNALIKESFLARPYVEPTRVKQLLARHLGFSETEQDHYLWRFPEALSGRDKESRPVPWEQWSSQPDTFDPFLDSDDLP